MAVTRTGPRVSWFSGRRIAWMLALPMILGIVVFAVYPFVYLLFLSFSESNLGRVFQDWVGFSNYADAVGDAKFTATIARSVGFSFLTTGMAMVLGVALALLLDQAVKGRDLIRTLILLPLLTPPVTVAVMWQLILMPQGGWLNGFLADLAIISEPVSFLGQPASAFFFLAVADVWQWSPFVALMAFAALQTLPEEVFDAAQLDCQTHFQIFRFITLPMLLPALIGIAVLKLVIAFKVFDLVFVLTAGGPGQATTVSSFYIYRVAIQQFDIGMAATQTILFAIVVGLATVPFTMAHDRADARLS